VPLRPGTIWSPDRIASRTYNYMRMI